MGVLGGSFDPIHYGHLRVALEVLQTLSLSTLKFIPCKQQVFKNHAPCTAVHRVAMLELAIAGVSAFEVETCEIQRETPSYMVETLLTLQQAYPQQALCLIVGADVAQGFDGWHQWQSIFSLAHIVVVTRPDYDIKTIPWLQQRLPQQQVFHPDALHQEKAGKILIFPTSPLAISAQAIRRQLANHHSPRFLLPDAVLNYIHQHHLYERV